ncbi:MAG: sigma-54-dependent Fis family transcriptional regulator [Sphingomonadales bacterium 32-68-7]|nr:MAG: sigma-54-dependent Fis family transcriptional regulator [Sphingomonadales bacterium 12-68-11]OYX10182.1 MAG: sigma-54-dependent Fis family transcriptional regulator [Sphingomonadales bacterium 32-68-7]
MGSKHFSQHAGAAHGNLANRLTAILSVGAAGEDVLFADRAEVPASGQRTVLLAHAGKPALGVASPDALHLNYCDAMSEATLGAAVACATAPGQPIAVDPESLSIVALAERLASSEIPVLITGPTGTGKEVLSRFIHERSPRRKGPFIALNCAAMPETMLEAMLFGHEKGSFTGANAAGEGFFRAAHGGTLLLDEIAEMPLALQAKLLRALQEGEVVPIGATRPVKVDVRIIACANRDLPLEVENGRFRADLYYRLNVFPLALSALRARAQDIPALAFAMLLRHAPKGRPVPWLGDAALAMLKLHGWPGNIRELENVMRRALLLAQDAEKIGPEHIVFDQAPRTPAAEPTPVPAEADNGGRLSNIVQLSEARAIMAMLAACGGHRANAARELGISERTLRYRLASFRDAGLAVGGARS